MGINRKLQQEIDRCMKRVDEYKEEFNELWLKLAAMEQAPKVVKLDVPAPQYSHACNKDSSLREKLLAEMKKQLKKMQRLREQIRAWMASPDVKDAEGLPEACRAIESDMERFKVCERENKIKAFSKVGLQQEERVDEAEAARHDSFEWLNSIVSRLEEQIEQYEADVEALAATEGGGKAKAAASPRAAELEGFIERHKGHIVRLEQVMRLLENEQVTPEEVDTALRDGLEYYLESSTEPDFQQDDVDLYAPIPLSEVDENIGKIVTPTGEKKKAAVEGENEPETPSTATSGKEGKVSRQSKSAAKRAARAAAQLDGSSAKKAHRAPPASPPGQTSPHAGSSQAGTPPSTRHLPLSPRTPTAAHHHPAAASPTTDIKTGDSGPGSGSGIASRPMRVAAAGTAWASLDATPATSPSTPTVMAPQGYRAHQPLHVPHLQLSPAHSATQQQLSPAHSMPQHQSEHSVGAQQHAGARMFQQQQMQQLLSPAQRFGFQVSQPQAMPKSPHAEGQQLSRSASQHGPVRTGSLHTSSSVPSTSASAAVAAAGVQLQQHSIYAFQPPHYQPQPQVHAQQPSLAQMSRQQSDTVVRPDSDEFPAITPPPGRLPPGKRSLAAATAAAAQPASSRQQGLPEMARSSAALSPRGAHLPASPSKGLNRSQSSSYAATPAASAMSRQMARTVSAFPGLAQPPPPPPPPPQYAASAKSASLDSQAPVSVLQHLGLATDDDLPEKATWGASSSSSSAYGPATEQTAAGQQKGKNALHTEKLPDTRSSSLPDDVGLTLEQRIAGSKPGAALPPADSLPPPMPLKLRAAPAAARSLGMLDAALRHKQKDQDAEWQPLSGRGSDGLKRPKVLRAPSRKLPAYLPNAVQPLLEEPATFRRLSTDTLFFAFYFQQGLPQQLLAAQQLMRQGWRFHTHLNAWFRRETEPKCVTSTFEQGSFVYFDFELHRMASVPGVPTEAATSLGSMSGWTERTSRPDFVFERRHMESEAARG